LRDRNRGRYITWMWLYTKICVEPHGSLSNSAIANLTFGLETLTSGLSERPILSLTMSTSSPDVLVVGAGPVGLTMAAELARHGVACRIIDQLATPLRAIGVTPRTLEVWEDTAATAYLIRPDGYIGYHGRPITQQGIIDYLAALS
jgi:hypothetical protein